MPISSRLGAIEESTLQQLSTTEDADIAKTLIEFNSQQAAYQAALKAGRASCRTRSWTSSASSDPKGDPFP